jgi:hypothetical protein
MDLLFLLILLMPLALGGELDIFFGFLEFLDVFRRDGI